MKKVGARYEPLSVGTTTSMRMDRFTGGLLERYGVRAIIGKGGLSAESGKHFQSLGGVYLAITGGAAALETTQIEAIEAVWWEDLMPECLWQFRVRGLGPLTVAMDSHGGNLYAEVQAEAQRRLAEMFSRLEKGLDRVRALRLAFIKEFRNFETPNQGEGPWYGSPTSRFTRCRPRSPRSWPTLFASESLTR